MQRSFLLSFLYYAVKAVTITSDKTVLWRVTQTLTLECKAMVNVDDTNVTFTWKKMGSGVVNTTTVFSPTNGMATAALDIPSLSVEEHHDQSYECHPRNVAPPPPLLPSCGVSYTTPPCHLVRCPPHV